MVPRNARAVWQSLAYRADRRQKRVAGWQGAGHHGRGSRVHRHDRPDCLDCYPSNTLGPVHAWDGPIFMQAPVAAFRRPASFRFSAPVKPLNIAGILPPVQSRRPVAGWNRSGARTLCHTTTTIQNRGSQTCINPLSSRRCFPRPFRPALSTTMASAPLSVQAVAHWLPARSAMIRSPGQPLVLAQARCAARLASASANNNNGVTAVWATLGNALGGLLHFGGK